MKSVADATTFRRFRPSDSEAIRHLDRWALSETETDPDDIPGREDLQDVEANYVATGGDFVVGVVPDDGGVDTIGGEPDLGTADGLVVAMGGYLPNDDGHADERSVSGAAELHRMRIAPPLQGEGLGKRLLVELEERAQAAGFDRLLATTATRQPRALAFYPSQGYERVDTSTWEDYDLVHFEKELP